MQVKLTLHLSSSRLLYTMNRNLLTLAQERKLRQDPELLSQSFGSFTALSVIHLYLSGHCNWPSTDPSPELTYLYRFSSYIDLLYWILVQLLERMRTCFLTSQWICWPWVQSHAARIRQEYKYGPFRIVGRGSLKRRGLQVGQGLTPSLQF